MDIGPTELIIILLIVVLIFGPGRLAKIAGEAGRGIRSFREGLKGEGDDEAKPAVTPTDPKDPPQASSS